MKHRLTSSTRALAVAAVVSLATYGGAGVAQAADAPRPTPTAPTLREAHQGGGLQPQWGLSPAPGQDCPTGSVKGTPLATEGFESGSKGRFTTGSGASLTSEGGATFLRTTGGGSAEATAMTSPAVSGGINRVYVKFSVRGTFGARELAVASKHGGGGWYVDPASEADPVVAPSVWRTVRLDLTDGANESTWGQALQVEWLRSGSAAATADVDNVEIYPCSPAPMGEPGDFNGDGLADAKFIMNDGRLVFVAGSYNAPITLWRGGTGWGNFTWISSAGDTNGDGFSDLLARTSSGDFYVYYGDGVRSFTGAARVGWGWNSMTSILAVGDVNRDGRQDLIARSGDGTMRLYSFRTDGGLEGGRVVGSGWQNFSHIVAIRTSANPPVATRLYAIAPGGDMKSYTVTSSGAMTGWGNKVGNGWSFPRVASVGDFDGDGLDDVLGVTAGGAAYIYPTNGDGRWKPTLTLPESWWNAATVIG